MVSIIDKKQQGFNTQPPEGGWNEQSLFGIVQRAFQHTAARRRLAVKTETLSTTTAFQHTAARRRLALKPTTV